MHTIETARLIIRPFVDDDLDAYHQQVYSDPEVTRYLPGGRPRSRQETADILNYFMDHERLCDFSIAAVLDKSTGELIGHCGLHQFDSGDVEIGYSFARARWGQGYAPEAGRAILRYGFESLNLNAIIALAMPPNLASQRVMQKIGMHQEGITTLYYQTELVLYRLARADFQPDSRLYRVIP
ncbi:MAG: GNAT family N-acetyltransferase [Anaerolineae bacterium]|nr:GNAT family N-acetyltransferase [Anaerolineae bacterium]